MDLTTPPPTKLSDLLELAIADARKLDHDRYTPMWMTWHRPRQRDGKCMVCLAGAVIAGTLDCSTEKSIDIATSDNADPQSTTITDKRWRRALWALDSAREGNWLKALTALHGTCPDCLMQEKLAKIPTPDKTEFHTWNELDAHLVSLAVCAGQLREIDL